MDAMVRRMVDLAAGLEYEHLPEAAVHAAKARLIDSMGVAIGALALLLIGGETFRGLAVNAALVMMLLYAAQGLGLVRHLLWRLGAQRYLVVLVYALLAFTSSFSVMALAFSGLADNWFDWRRIGHRREESDQEVDK